MWSYIIIYSPRNPQLAKQWALEQVLMARGKGGKPWHMAHQFPTPRREVKGSWTTRAGVRNSDWWDQSGCPPAAGLPHQLLYMCPIWEWPDFRWEHNGVLYFVKYAPKNMIISDNQWECINIIIWVGVPLLLGLGSWGSVIAMLVAIQWGYITLLVTPPCIPVTVT